MSQKKHLISSTVRILDFGLYLALILMFCEQLNITRLTIFLLVCFMDTKYIFIKTMSFFLQQKQHGRIGYDICLHWRSSEIQISLLTKIDYF